MTDAMQESFVEGAEGSGREVPWWMVRFIKLPSLTLISERLTNQDLEEIFRMEGKSA